MDRLVSLQLSATVHSLLGHTTHPPCLLTMTCSLPTGWRHVARAWGSLESLEFSWRFFLEFPWNCVARKSISPLFEWCKFGPKSKGKLNRCRMYNPPHFEKGENSDKRGFLIQTTNSKIDTSSFSRFSIQNDSFEEHNVSRQQLRFILDHELLVHVFRGLLRVDSFESIVRIDLDEVCVVLLRKAEAKRKTPKQRTRFTLSMGLPT